LKGNHELKSFDLIRKLVTYSEIKENSNHFNDILYHYLLIFDKNV